MEREHVVRLNPSPGYLVGARCIMFIALSPRIMEGSLKSLEAHHFPPEFVSRPPAWAMRLPSWTTTEHMSWMFCPDPGSDSEVLYGVEVFELALALETPEASEAETLLEAACEGADDDSGAEYEDVVGGGACCCVVVVG